MAYLPPPRWVNRGSIVAEAGKPFTIYLIHFERNTPCCLLMVELYTCMCYLINVQNAALHHFSSNN